MRITKKISQWVESFRMFWGQRKMPENPVQKIQTKRRTRFSPEKQAKLEGLCQQLFKKKELLHSGKLQLIGLAKIKRRLGKGWEGLCKIVYDTVEEVIDQYLEPSDIAVRFSDDTYIIIFAKADREKSAYIAFKIAEEIRRRLFEMDEKELKSLEIRQATGEIKSDFLKGFGFSEFIDFIDSELDAEKNTGFYPEPPALNAEDQSLDTKAKKSPITIERVEIDPTKYRKNTESIMKAPLPGDLAYSYLPIWDVRRNALTTYLCLARLSATSNVTNESIFKNHRALFARLNKDQKITLDIQILRHVMAELETMEQTGRQFLIGCPVGLETLYEFDRYEAYKQELENIPNGQRQYLVFYVIQSSERLPIKDPYWFARPLRQFASHVFAELPLRRDLNYTYLRNTGVNIAGVCLDNVQGSEQEIINLLNIFSAKAKTHKIPYASALGVSSLSLATSSICGGFDFIGGSIISDKRDQPIGIERYSQEDLLSNLITKK